VKTLPSLTGVDLWLGDPTVVFGYALLSFGCTS